MSFQLDIWLIQILISTNYSNSEWLNVLKLHLVIFFCYPFTYFWFNTIVFFRWSFNVLFIFLFFMFVAQVYCRTISITWRIIGFTCLLIGITSVVYLIFLNGWGVFLLCFFSSILISYFSLLLGLSVSWIISFPFIKAFVFFLLILRGVRSLSSNTAIILAPGLDIPERLGISLLKFIYFGCSMLILLSDKIADETDLDLFIYFTLSSVSFLWEALDLSNDIPLFDSLLIDSPFLLWDSCGELWLSPPYYVFFHVIIHFFGHILCSRDQWVFGRHDPGAWSFLIGLIQNQGNFIG